MPLMKDTVFKIYLISAIAACGTVWLGLHLFGVRGLLWATTLIILGVLIEILILLILRIREHNRRWTEEEERDKRDTK